MYPIHGVTTFDTAMTLGRVPHIDPTARSRATPIRILRDKHRRFLLRVNFDLKIHTENHNGYFFITNHNAAIPPAPSTQ